MLSGFLASLMFSLSNLISEYFKKRGYLRRSRVRKDVRSETIFIYKEKEYDYDRFKRIIASEYQNVSQTEKYKKIYSLKEELAKTKHKEYVEAQINAFTYALTHVG